MLTFLMPNEKTITVYNNGNVTIEPTINIPTEKCIDTSLPPYDNINNITINLLNGEQVHINMETGIIYTKGTITVV